MRLFKTTSFDLCILGSYQIWGNCCCSLLEGNRTSLFPISISVADRYKQSAHWGSWGFSALNLNRTSHIAFFIVMEGLEPQQGMAVDCLLLNTKYIDLFLFFGGQLYTFWKERSAKRKGRTGGGFGDQVRGEEHFPPCSTCSSEMTSVVLKCAVWLQSEVAIKSRQWMRGQMPCL